MIAARLVSAVVAVTVLVLAVAAGMMRARRLAEEDVHAIAPQMFREKNQGAMLQRAALRQPDLLPLYGSSELNLPSTPLRSRAVVMGVVPARADPQAIMHRSTFIVTGTPLLAWTLRAKYGKPAAFAICSVYEARASW